MKRSLVLILSAGIIVLAVQCGPGNQPGKPMPAAESAAVKKTVDTLLIMAGINSKGIGRFHDVRLAHPPDEKMAARGLIIYQSKCFACHKLNSELLVGPGWAGVTDRRTPEWIMNWITNTKVMLEKDLAAQADMALCLIRMPNQDLTDDQARDVLEFMRKNDGRK